MKIYFEGDILLDRYQGSYDQAIKYRNNTELISPRFMFYIFGSL